MEEKVEELLVAEPDLTGLRRLQELGLLTPSTTAARDGTLASSWTTTTAATTDGTTEATTEASTDDRVHLDAQGRVTYLNLGGKRLHRGLDASLFQNHFSTLRTLNLGGTDLPAQNTVDILNTRTVGRTLESLHLGGNGLGDEGIELLAASWRSLNYSSSLPQLRKLDLRYNDISGAGMTALCRALQQDGGGACPNLRFLHMERNAIGDDGCRALAEWMLWQPPTARSNDDDRDSSSSSACRLEQVFLGANSIGPAGAAHLAQALQSNSSKLTKLYLEGNRIGEEGAAALSRALENANHGDSATAALKNLYVDNNNIGKEGSRRLAKALNSATAIPDGI